MTRANSWPEEKLAELRRLWSSGMPASGIALKIGKTRSAVLGMAHRLELEDRDAASQMRRPSTQAMIDLVADENIPLDQAAAIADVRMPTAERNFRDFRNRYDFGLPPRIDDDMVKGPERPLRPLAELDAIAPRQDGPMIRMLRR